MKGRVETEGNVVSCFFKDMLLLDEVALEQKDFVTSDGLFYFSRDYVDEKSWGTDIGLYKFDANSGIFEKI